MFAQDFKDLNSLVIEIIVLSSVMNAETFRSSYFETE